MSENNHTKGEWERFDTSVRCGDKFIAFTMTDWVKDDKLVLDDTENEANGNLIAAAPDLLEACEKFIEAYEKSLQLEKTDVALRMAKKAIAKAKGGK